MKTIKHNLTNREASVAIDNREDFSNATSSLVGVTNPFTIGRGWLNDDEYTTLREHMDAGIAYVVYSYETPIAWVLNDGRKYRVSQKFSPTTSKHMGLTWTSDLAKVEA